ncbi:MAG: type II secretion system protein [Eubacteriales bacterium]|nr:type II secretion system protein [Eubacteriales bacterium]
MSKKNVKRNKGFTLVELIVVLVILAILAAILVPALLGYIDRAKQEKSVRKVHDIQVASTSALVEYYGIYKDKVSKKFTPKNYTVNGRTVRGYSVTNFTFAKLQDKNSSGNDCSDAVAKRILQYLESNKDTKEKEYTFKKYDSATYGKSASEIANAGAEGLIILFGEDYKLSVIQYSDLDGYLYTYDAQSGEIDVQKNGSFVATGK